LDFLVVSYDFAPALPADIPVFAHGAGRCQRSVIMLPLNDCLGGLVDEYHQQLVHAGYYKGRRLAENLRKATIAENRLAWRGMVRRPARCAGGAGSCQCAKEAVAQNFSQLKRWPRFRLLDMARRFPHLIDARGRCSLTRDNAGDCNLAMVDGPVWLGAGFEDIPGFAWEHFLFHASVDATAYNTLANWRPLLLGRVLVKQVSHIRVAWFRHGLRPHEHYVPARFDLADVPQRIAEARANASEPERIRKKGFIFGWRYLRQCQLYARLHVAAALNRYADLQDF